MSHLNAQPIAQTPPGIVLDLQTEEDRIRTLRAMGAKNVDPPLPRSSHLKVISNGRVVPWLRLLAEQPSLVVNCDANGNTDPAAWQPTVTPDYDDTIEQQRIRLEAEATVRAEAKKLTEKFRVDDAINVTPRPMGLPEGIVTYNDINKLREMLEG